MQWERTDRPTAILMIYQSHRSTWVNFNTWSKWPKGTTPVTSKQLQVTFSSQLITEWGTLRYGWQVTSTALPRVLSLRLAALGRPAGSSPSQTAPRRSQVQTRWVYSVTQFSKCHILIQPLNLVMSYRPLSLLLRSTIFSFLWLPLCTSRQPRQVAWPGNTAEAVQRNCSICTFSSAAATLLPTALLEVCCDVFMKTCQIFPTINPGV